MFDECMLMLPFATRTDMQEAMSKADVPIARIQDLVRELYAEHESPSARSQLKTLWLTLAHQKYGDDEEAAGSSKPGAAPMPGKSKTPPGSPPA
jgi:hypothetical protein